MRYLFLVSLIFLALAAASPAFADQCSCSYGGARPCSASANCPEPEEAHCSCTRRGCSASCGAAGPNQANDLFSVIQFTGMSLDGFREHLAGRRSGWTVAAKSTFGEPLTNDVISRSYIDLTFEQLAETVANDFGLCVEIDERRKILAFKKPGLCLR